MSVGVDSAEREVHSDFWCLAPQCPSSRDAAIKDVMSVPHPASAASSCNCLCWEMLTPHQALQPTAQNSSQPPRSPAAFPETLLPSHRPWDSPRTYSPHPCQTYASRAGETPLTSHCVLSASFSFLCDFDWGLNERKQGLFYRPAPF